MYKVFTPMHKAIKMKQARLSMAETLKVANWLQDRKNHLSSRTGASVAQQIANDLSFDVSASTVIRIARELGIELGRKAPNAGVNTKTFVRQKKLVEIMYGICEHLYGKEHVHTVELQKMRDNTDT